MGTLPGDGSCLLPREFIVLCARASPLRFAADPALATLRPFLLASPRRAGPALPREYSLASSALMNWNRSMPSISITHVRSDNGDISTYPRAVTFNSILFLFERYGKLCSEMFFRFCKDTRYLFSVLDRCPTFTTYWIKKYKRLQQIICLNRLIM